MLWLTRYERMSIGSRRCWRGGSLWHKIAGRRECPPPTICARLYRPVNALQLCRWMFTQRNFLADFLREKLIFLHTKNAKFAFLRPLWGLGATYAVHLRLIGKLIVDFLLVVIYLFFARCFRFVTINAFDRRTDRQTDGLPVASTRLHSCSA